MDRNMKMGLGMVFFALLILTVSGAVYLARRPAEQPKATRARDDESTDTRSSPARAVAPTPTSKEQRMLLAKTLKEAADAAEFQDTFGKLDPGAVLFTVWAKDRLSWEDVSADSGTSTKKIMKDPSAERGKTACWSGMVIEIHAQDAGHGEKVFDGNLMTEGQQIISFVAMRDTGEIVEQSIAKFCGVIVGLHDYQNSVGGTAHGIQVVGMFDLPKNHAAPPKKIGDL